MSMSEHEKSITVSATPEEAFRYLSSVSNLTSFVPHLRMVREDEDGHIFGMADIAGHHQEISGFFRADEANCRLDWESDGTPGYRGWLQISPNAKGCQITVHISMLSAAGEGIPDRPGLAGERIEREFGRVLETVRQRVEEVHQQMPA